MQPPRPPYQPLPQPGPHPQRPPMYGPQMQYGPPPQKSGVPTWGWVLIFAAIIAAGVMVVLVFFTNVFAGTPEIDQSKVESAAQGLLDDHGAGTLSNLQCPTMEAEKGATYICSGEVDGYDVKITVSVQDDEGATYIEIN